MSETAGSSLAGDESPVVVWHRRGRLGRATGTARAALAAAEVVLGGPRQLELLPPSVAAVRLPWPSPMRPAVPGLLSAHAGRRIAVLASGDPMFLGIGSDARRPARCATRCGCCRMSVGVPGVRAAGLGAGRERGGQRGRADRWPRCTAALHARAAAAGAERATRRRRARSPSCSRRPGTGRASSPCWSSWAAPPSGSCRATARDWAHAASTRSTSSPSSAGPSAERALLAVVPGLPDDAYEHDGQLTKRHVRAVTLARLAPLPGELLWDVGGGAGQHRDRVDACAPPRAAAVARGARSGARRAHRAQRGRAGRAGARGSSRRPRPPRLAGLEPPDAVFIGGGLTATGVLDACWAALAPGGRLVANAVTLESEALLAAWRTEARR